MEIRRDDLADLTAKATIELPAAQQSLTALANLVAAQAKLLDTLAATIKVQDDMLARQSRITDLADTERDAYKARAERLARGDRWQNAQAKAGLGALVCAPFSLVAGPFAPAIPLACGLVGGVYGFLSGGE